MARCRRFAIEPIIGHLKAEGHLGRGYLKGRGGDAASQPWATTSAASSPDSEKLLYPFSLWTAFARQAPVNRAP